MLLPSLAPISFKRAKRGSMNACPTLSQP
jgi:hypothetical protein